MSRLPDLRRAERMALRVLAAKCVTTLPVQPLALLRACRDTLVLTIDEAAERLAQPAAQLERLFADSEAVTMQCLHQYIVIYRPGGNPARLRFTLAHELGHRLLGHDGADAAEEREANHFASHLLCPEPLLARLREHDPIPIRQLATACYVSPTCAKAAAHRPPAQADATLLRQVTAQLSETVERLCPARTAEPLPQKANDPEKHAGILWPEAE